VQARFHLIVADGFNPGALEIVIAAVEGMPEFAELIEIADKAFLQ
jgi:hypothetical protein